VEVYGVINPNVNHGLGEMYGKFTAEGSQELERTVRGYKTRSVYAVLA